VRHFLLQSTQEKERLGSARQYPGRLFSRDVAEISAYAALNLQPSSAVNRFWGGSSQTMAHCCSTLGSSAHLWGQKRL